MVVLCCGAALGAKLFDVGHSDLPSAIFRESASHKFDRRGVCVFSCAKSTFTCAVHVREAHRSSVPCFLLAVLFSRKLSICNSAPAPIVSIQFRLSRKYDCFQFGTLRAHVECNHARGKDVAVSRPRAHFYVYCNKRGSLWNYTDWWPFLDYEVNPAWITSWWCLQSPGCVSGVVIDRFVRRG